MRTLCRSWIIYLPDAGTCGALANPLNISSISFHFSWAIKARICSAIWPPLNFA
ncbi:hypothetical protein H206_05387 [Candidatus Electrothrix aarhusensis]|uniref:Uncharacterized protein n=1 Tax=Candidatus Electrothrix aarhusensis TaxID=1859131 RepID=A0A444J4L7_9BACT|nr:hypothetical protein H206_05387 [Candidatus Electrothrix aarhusensis]